MADVFKVVWEFSGPKSEQFSEVYYKNASDVDDATNTPTGLISRRLDVLHPAWTFVRIRASSVKGNRVTATRALGYSGEAAIEQDTTVNGPLNLPIVTVKKGIPGGPGPVGEAVVLSLSGKPGGIGQKGGTRKLWMRGFPSLFIVRDPQSGKDRLWPGVSDALGGFFALLEKGQYGLRTLRAVDNNVVFLEPIVQAIAQPDRQFTALTVGNRRGIAKGDRVLLTRFDQKQLPGLKGGFTVTDVLSPGGGAMDSLVIRYRMPDTALRTVGLGVVRAQVYQDLSIFNAAKCNFAYYGTRTSKNPYTHSRGARRASRVRDLA